MDKRSFQTRLWPPLFLILSFALTACPSTTGPGGPPQITSFTANPARITAPGQAVRLSWEISGGVTGLSIDQEVGPVSGTSTVVFPSAATTYTLTATNSTSSDTETVAVGFGAGPGGPPGNRDPVAAFTSTRVASDAPGVRVRFSALESSDPDGDPLSYTWDFGDGSGASSRDFTKTYREDGTYEVSLTVSDARGGSDTATETLEIDVPGDTPAPPPPPLPPPPPPPEEEDPVARIAYSPDRVSQGDLVTLDGGGSSDPDGGAIAAYAWSVTGPRGNTARFTGKTPSFNAAFAGRYTLSLVVADDEGAESEAATATITVAGAGNNRPPTVEISGGDVRRAVEGVPVALVAVGDDPDNDRLSYRWTARPPAGVTFSSPTSPITRATFADNDDDDYTITVTVRDGRGGSASDEVAFEVDEADEEDGNGR